MKQIAYKIAPSILFLCLVFLPNLVFAFGSASSGIQEIDAAGNTGTTIVTWASRIAIILGFTVAGIGILFVPGQGVVKLVCQLALGGLLMVVGLHYAPGFFGFSLTH